MPRSERVVVSRRQMAPGVGCATFAPLNQLEHLGLEVLREFTEDLGSGQLDVLREEGQAAGFQCVGVEAVGDPQHANHALTVNH